MKLFFPQNYSG